MVLMLGMAAPPWSPPCQDEESPQHRSDLVSQKKVTWSKNNPRNGTIYSSNYYMRFRGKHAFILGYGIAFYATSEPGDVDGQVRYISGIDFWMFVKRNVI